jgi:hypothetical protein
MSTSNGSFGNYGNISVVYINKKNTKTPSSATDTILPGFLGVITPTSASNKVLCLCSFSGYQPQQAGFSFARNGTNLSAATSAWSRNIAQFADGFNVSSSNACCSFGAYLDSPASTSALTYTLMTNNQGVVVDINEVGATTTYIGSSYIILLEV